jgi:alkyl sulfatase BDS1-like metallo-beta-lactamase superfamily hydrolase
MNKAKGNEKMDSFKSNFSGMSALLLLTLVLLQGAGCAPREQRASQEIRDTDAIETITQHCRDDIGSPRVEQVSEHVWVAIGYDLANTVLIHTDEGNIIVDTSQCPAAAHAIKKAFSETAPPGPVKAIIYTHTHIDHVGGASEWVEEGTRIWAQQNFVGNFIKQYGTFMQAEKARGYRQFGYHLAPGEVPCSAIGPVLKSYALKDLAETGTIMPTDTFSGIKSLEIGGLTIELHTAPGETDDTIFIWIPADKTLLCADDYYSVFPNLYTIRGTSPRPVDGWINSLDQIRRLQPEQLVPSHTSPVIGSARIGEILTNYRDAIQWVRDEVIRRANAGQDIDTIAENVKLPPQLARLPYLWEGYGQVSWSARAIYTNNEGWFDGRADKLYPLNHDELARREVELMGGPEKLAGLAGKALSDGDPRWAVHLLAKLKDSGLASGDAAADLNSLLAAAYRQIADTTSNTNGRAYLLESALELDKARPPDFPGKLHPGLVAGLPVDLIFTNMQPRLVPDKARGVYESVCFIFPDVNRQFTVTIRNGVAEIAEGQPLPGTPGPVAVVTADSLTYKMMALKMLDTMAAFTQGKIKVEGSLPGFITFMGRFQN